MKEIKLYKWRMIGIALILIGMSFALGHTIAWAQSEGQAEQRINAREIRIETQAERIKELDEELTKQKSLYGGLEEAYSELKK